MVKSTKLVLLLLFLFSIVLGQEPLEYEEKEKKQEYSNSKSFALKKNGDFNKEYLHVIIKSKGKRNQYAIVSNSTNCDSGRKLVGMAPYGSVNLVIPKSQLSESLYLCVKCTEENCNYEMTLRGENLAKFSIGEQYSYYIKDDSSLVMSFEFEVKTQPQVNFRGLSTVNTVHNIWVKGENLKQVRMANSIPSSKEYSFGHGKIYRIKYDSNINSYQLVIGGEIGDYITVGSNEINDKVSTALKVNDQEIMAVITKEDEQSKEICFPTNKLEEIKENEIVYMNGIVFTKKLKTYYREKVGGNIEEMSDKNITESNIVEAIYYDDYKSEKVYCASFLPTDKKDYAVFSLQLSSNTHNVYNQFVYPPQYPGVIYPHFLLKGEIAVFRGMKPKQGASEINFNMKALVGFPDMLYDNCTTYPDCLYNDEKLNNIKDPHHSNRMSVYSFYLKDEKEITPISQFQPLMIVKCREGTKYKNKTSEYCIFETTIFTNKDRLKLREVESISQFLLKNESDLYSVDFEGEEGVKKIYLDLIVFSGDVKFKIDDEEVNKAANKYFLANKIFYSIHNDKLNNKTKINFSVVAQKNSFYIISYQLVKAGENELNIRESGVNFVESVAVGEEEANHKLIYLQNFREDVGVPFLASFYSKNCRFTVTRLDNPNKPQKLEQYGDFSQVIINNTDDCYYNDKYIFNLSILNDDVSFYDRKNCMVYISGLELENKDTGGQRAISLSEGVPHSFIFSENYYTISYSYHSSDLTLPVVIDFNLIDKATFKVAIYFEYFLFKNATIYRNHQILIYPKDLKNNCLEDEVCTINIIMSLDRNSTKLGKRIETTITQVNGAPIYLGKNVVRQDFLVGENPKFYYLDIGKGEQGDITVNYKRMSGNIYATIVKKTDLKDVSSADWRGIYKFPKDKSQSLPYEPYLKKIIIEPKDTENCDEGCFALITVQKSSLKSRNETDQKEVNMPYRFTIIPRVIQGGLTNYTDIPSVTIPMNEYVIGNIEVSDKENLYYYYNIILPFESEYLMIDWQADAPILIMNVGTKNPSIEKNDFKFNCTAHDHVILVPKKELLDLCKKKSIALPNPDSIRYLPLTFAVYTRKVDTLYTSVYAFKLFMPPTYILNNNEKMPVELIHIRSDQKVQCDPLDAKLCIFAVIFEESDINSHLILYPKGQNENAKIIFNGDLVDSAEIEKNNVGKIVEQLQNLTGHYNSNERNYVYIDKIPKDKSFLFFVESDIPTIIEVLSSTSKDYYFTPNPSTPQLFSLETGKKVNLNFETTQDLLINIVCVSGEGFFQWEEENVKKYYLYGKDDRLTLTSGTNNTDNKLSSLVGESSTFNWYKSDNSGFVFYITYYPRNSEYNIDQVKAGRSTEFNYRDIKFPLHFFTPVKDKDITVSFNFYNFYSKEKIVDLKYNGPLLKIWGNIITQEQAYNARMEKQLKPTKNELTVNGTTDGPFGTIYFNFSMMEGAKLGNKTDYALYFVVDMEKNKIPTTNLNGASMEVTILREQTNLESNLFAPENIYVNGKLSNNEILNVHYFRHRLRTDFNNPYMLIEFSAISSDVRWFINTREFSDNNVTELPEMEDKFANGKRIVIFKVPFEKVENNSLYLIVYNENKNSTNKIDSKLANYVFKYMNGQSKDSLFNFTLKNSKVECKKNETNYELSFDKPFDPLEGESITYYVKGIYNKSMIKGERINSIAISESNGTYLQAFNTTPGNNSKISLKLENVKEDLSCIKVLAKGTSNAINLYALYDVVSIGGVNCSSNEDARPGNKGSSGNNDNKGNKGNEGKKGDKSNNKNNRKLFLYIIIAAGSLLAIIIIILIIYCAFCRNKKDLKESVEQISFSNEDRDGLVGSD